MSSQVKLGQSSTIPSSYRVMYLVLMVLCPDYLQSIHMGMDRVLAVYLWRKVQSNNKVCTVKSKQYS